MAQKQQEIFGLRSRRDNRILPYTDAVASLPEYEPYVGPGATPRESALDALNTRGREAARAHVERMMAESQENLRRAGGLAMDAEAARVAEENARLRAELEALRSAGPEGSEAPELDDAGE